MPMYVKEGGVWKQATPQVKDAGVWKPVKEGYVKDAGVWKEFLRSFSVTAGALATRENSNTFNLGNVSLNGTAEAGDLIVLTTVGSDNGSGDTSYSVSITGFTPVVSLFARQSTVGASVLSAHIHKKVATGGETSVAVNGSWNAFGGTMDATGCRPFLLKGLSSTTEIDTNSGGLALPLNTAGAQVVIGCGSGANSGTGGGNLIGITGGPLSRMDSAVDDAPLGGAADPYDLSPLNISFLSGAAVASWG